MTKRNVFIALFALLVSQQTFACNPAQGTGQCTWDGVHYGPNVPNSDQWGVRDGGGYGYSRPQTRTIRVPDQYGTIGYSRRLSNIFQIDNQPSARKAKKALFKECGSDCTVLSTYRNGCSVAVQGEVSGGLYTKLTGTGATLSEARAKAFQVCNSRANNCHEITYGCSLPDI